jgi:uncharacterized Zn finger protein (UPF0148 family)
MKIEKWQKENKWSRKYDKCIVCGTTEIKHNGNGMCKICYNIEWLKKNPEKLNGYRVDTKRWRERNSDSESYKKKNRERTKKWREENPKGNSSWRKKNPEKLKEYSKKDYSNCKEYHKTYCFNRRQIDFRYKLRCNISTLIGSRLKFRLLSKNGKSTFDFLPYTVDELIRHLENLFEPWMNWDNWGIGKGKWNIDHKKPDSLFNYKSVEDKEFQKCWALNNLQPMDAIENIKKGNRYE